MLSGSLACRKAYRKFTFTHTHFFIESGELPNVLETKILLSFLIHVCVSSVQNGHQDAKYFIRFSLSLSCRMEKKISDYSVSISLPLRQMHRHLNFNSKILRAS